MSDILVDIPDEDLPELLKLYETHIDWAPFIHCFIDLGIRWKRSKNANLITFMSPNNSWRKDGTIIALHTYHCYDLVMFTLEESCENLYQGLLRTKRIDFNPFNKRGVWFFGIHNKHIPTVQKIAQQFNLKTERELPCYMFSMEPEKAETLVVDCPPDIYLKKLSSDHATQINAAWPHRYPDSDKYLATLIEMNGGVGAFLKSNDQLVAWSIVHSMGHVGLVQTEEGYKKRGYGSLVVKALSKEIVQGGHWPCGHVMTTNVPSLNMFEKLGFRNIGFCAFMLLKKDE